MGATHSIVRQNENPKQGTPWEAFLTFNETFEIVSFSMYLECFHREIFEEDMPCVFEGAASRCGECDKS